MVCKKQHLIAGYCLAQSGERVLAHLHTIFSCFPSTLNALQMQDGRNKALTTLIVNEAENQVQPAALMNCFMNFATVMLTTINEELAAHGNAVVTTEWSIKIQNEQIKDPGI